MGAVTFNANGGSGTMSSQTFVQGESQALTANTFTRPEYVFECWNTQSDGHGISYSDKKVASFLANTTLYAQWQDDDNIVVTVNGVSFVMIAVEGGTFNMGMQYTDGYAPNFSAYGATDCTIPVHSVTLDDYYIAQTELSQALWGAVIGSWPTENVFRWTGEIFNGTPLPALGVGDNYPMYCIPFDAAQEFIAALNDSTGLNFRLPTEAEWEYAARGGNRSNGYLFPGTNDPYSLGTRPRPSTPINLIDTVPFHEIKSNIPNELGIYDLAGNVFEWCSDWYDCDYYSVSPSYNPTGGTSGSYRSLRSSSIYTGYDYSGARTWNPYGDMVYMHVGLRLVLEP